MHVRGLDHISLYKFYPNWLKLIQLMSHFPWLAWGYCRLATYRVQLYLFGPRATISRLAPSFGFGKLPKRAIGEGLQPVSELLPQVGHDHRVLLQHVVFFPGIRLEVE